MKLPPMYARVKPDRRGSQYIYTADEAEAPPPLPPSRPLTAYAKACAELYALI